MECHKCRHAAAIAAGKYRGKPWKATPCAKCKAAESENHHGRTHVRFDDALKIIEHPAFALKPDPRENGDFSIPALAHVMHSLLSLDPMTMEIVMFRLADPFASLRVLSERIQVPISTVHDRLKKARQEWPALAYAIPMKERSAPQRETAGAGRAAPCGAE